MIQIRIESGRHSHIFRVLQVDPQQTILNLEFLISVVFEIDGIDEAHFEVTRHNGKEVNQIITLSGDLDGKLNSEEEIVSDWLVKEGDEMFYRFDNRGELKLTLEKVMSNLQKPDTCIEGEWHLNSNKKNVDLEEMNAKLSMSKFITEMDDIDEILEPDYLTLFQLADDLKKLKPWQYFYNEEIIALQVEDVNETFFVSVMGAGGQEYGLMVYDEELGYQSLAAILEGNELPDDFHLELSALAVSFVDRSELDQEDFDLIKECGLSYSGKKNWIAFRSYEPGLIPIIPLYIEVEILKLVVQAVINVTHMRINGWQYPPVGMYEFPKFDVSENGEIELMQVIHVEPNKVVELAIEVNDLEKAQLKKKPKSTVQIEFDLFYLPFAVAEDGERPLFPVLFIVMHSVSGEVLAHDMMPFPKLPFIQQQMFWQMLLEMPVLPSKVFVKQEMSRILQPLAKMADVELVVSELPHIRHLREIMEELPPF
jgi:hypothetical protein